MSRKRVTADEKKTRMLELFHETGDFYQLKELEKLGPKEKGVIANAVKDVVQGLVDDGLVETDKIGTSVYFWSFPGKAHQVKKKRLAHLNKSIESVKLKLAKTKAEIAKAQEGKENVPEREEALQENDQLHRENSKLRAQLDAHLYASSGTAVVQRKQQEIEVAKEAANRWTDNIFAVKSWCKNKFFVEESVLDKQFGIPPDLDYVD